MARPDGRIEKGQRLSSAISARAWNRAQEAADRVLGAGTGFEADGVRGFSAPYSWVYCKNTTEETVPRWGVLEIAGLEIEPTTPESEETGDNAATKSFQEMPVLAGAMPSIGSLFCIALEPIASQKIGRVALSGVVQVKLDIQSEDDNTATVKDDSVEELQTGVGSAEILWKESGTGPGKWGLIRFGSSGTGGKARLCKTTEVWIKNTNTTLEVWESGSRNAETSSNEEILGAVNKMGAVGSGKFVVIVPAENGRYYLVAAEC